MQGDDPPFLTVGTDVSAKYKGAFCEAKIKKVVRNIKCKVTLKLGGSTTVNDDQIKGNLHVGNTVEVKIDPKKDPVEAIITKMQDCSQYTVVFDDGDITTLRRSALCLKSGRHFNESETLDQLPLTHPEHFSTPVIAGRRGRRGRAQSEESEVEARVRVAQGEREPHAGRVVLVETGSGGERRRPHQAAFPALVVAPTAQDTVKIKVKEDYLVRSFKDGRYYTVPKKEAREFRKGSAPAEWGGVEAALQYLNNGTLPPHWDRDLLFNEPGNASDDSSDDEPREEKDHFVAQLFKFMDDRGTPLNRNPTIANRDIDLYKLFSGVQKLGGYNRVTNQNQWKNIAVKMGFQPATASITNLCKQAYKKFLHDFEDFYRKLGVTLVAHPRGARTPPSGRSLIRDKDKLTASGTSSQTPSTSRSKEEQEKPEKSAAKPEKKESKEDDKKKSEKEEKTVKSEVSDEDSADNQPLAAPAPIKAEKEEKVKEKPKPSEDKEKERTTKSRAPVDTVKKESTERRNSKPRRPPSIKSGDSGGSSVRSSRRPHASTDSDSSGRASRCGVLKKTPSRRSQSANSASSGNTIASSNSSRRPRKRPADERTSPADSLRSSTGNNITAAVGDKLKVYYGPNQSESKVTYDAKVIEKTPEGMLKVHYLGWNNRYDEWIKPQRIAVNVSQHDRTRPKQDGSRRARSARIKELNMNSDTDSDSDTEEEERVKLPPNRNDEKPTKTVATPSAKSKPATPPPRKKSAAEESTPSTGERSRKRSARSAASASAPSTSSLPAKRMRSTLLHSSHQGRDYDLNEIRSELKGLHTVKTEPEEIKTEIVEKTPPPPEPVEEPKQEKPDDDVYEFKEPEPFEFELHEEKKKRTHRIFDDVSPKYSMKSIMEEMNEEIRSRPAPRASSLSPFNDYSVRETNERIAPEDDSRDDIFSLDGDSFAGDSLGPDFEGFTPAKNQETYSKKNRMKRLPKEILDEPLESPDEDDASSDDDRITDIDKDESNLPPLAIEPSNEPIDNPTLDLPKEVNNKTAAEQSPKVIVEQITDVIMQSCPIYKPDESVKPKNEPSRTSTLTNEQPRVASKEDSKVDEIKLEKDKIKSEKEPQKIEKDKCKTEKEKPKVEKDKLKTDKDKPKSEKEKPKQDKEKPKQDINKPKLEKDKTKIEKEKPKPEKEKPKLEKEKPKQDKTKTEKEKIINEKDKNETNPVKPPTKQFVAEKKPEDTKKIEDLKATLVEPVRSALVDTEESKSEPDSPAREELIPEPPAFLLHSEGPKIAEKLLKAINSAKKRISTSPPPEEASKTSKRDFPKAKVDLFKSSKDVKSPIAPTEPSSSPANSPNQSIRPKTDPPKPSVKVDPIKPKVDKTVTTPVTARVTRSQTTKKVLEKPDPLDMIETFKIEIPPESRMMMDAKREKLEASLAPLQSALEVLGRRRSNSELVPSGKNNKVLSDTIQKLSTQITQGQPPIPLPKFPSDDRDTSDSDDSDRRLIIDKLSEEETASGSSSEGRGAGALTMQDKTKSPVEWSAGESLLMLEDFCKADRARAAGAHPSIPKPTEEDSNISLLLCEETIPGSPAPEAGAGGEAPQPRARSIHMPFASAPSNSPEEGSKSGRRSGDSKGDRDQEADWERELDERHAPMETTPPTTPESSPDASPTRERRMSEQDSTSGLPGDEDRTDKPQPAKLFSGRSRKASESSGAGATRRARRSRRDSDERPAVPPPPTNHKYNFLVEIDQKWDSDTRINILMTKMAELRRAYHKEKAELAAIDRRRKKLRRKEREAVKAAKAACS